MLRAYRRDVVLAMCACQESRTFIPALACLFARKIAEVPVGHADRSAGESKYSLLKLFKLQADLVTAFTTVPLKLATFTGTLVALVSLGFGLFLGVRRLMIGPEAEGMFTLFAILFFLMGGNFLALGLLGFGLFLGIRRLMIGPEAEGMFTLFAILFFLMGGNFLALGLLGEYVGRIYHEVRRRPRSIVAETINVAAEPAREGERCAS